MDDLITTKDAAAILGIKPQSLRARVYRGLQPRPVKVYSGYPNLYRKSEVINVLTKNDVGS